MINKFRIKNVEYGIDHKEADVTIERLTELITSLKESKTELSTGINQLLEEMNEMMGDYTEYIDLEEL